MTHITPSFGYKIISENSINFYHVLLQKIRIPALLTHLQEAKEISFQPDGSITIAFTKTVEQSAIERLLLYFAEKENLFLQTPKYHYKVPDHLRQTMKTWILSFEGCLGLLFEKKFQLVSSTVGGLFLDPYILFFYKDHPRIIHPIAIQNVLERESIEKETAQHVRLLLKRMGEAQPGLEGLSLIRTVEEKTGMSQKEIASIIERKTADTQTPIYSGLISDEY